MSGIRKLFIFAVVFLSSVSFFARPARAASLADVASSGSMIITKIGEGIEYFFTFKTEGKVQVLDRQAERKLTRAQEFADEGNTPQVENMMQEYTRLKEKQDDLLDKTDGEVLGIVAERTIEQQKTMEQIKTKLDGDAKHIVVQTQEQVVNQVANRIVVENGPEGQTEFFQKVEHVWAPGTGPGGEAGVIIEGGTMQFAPGTSAGGPATSDIKTVVVEGGSGQGGNVVEGGPQTVVEGGNPEGETVVTQ